jgi:hypothetical protein
MMSCLGNPFTFHILETAAIRHGEAQEEKIRIYVMKWPQAIVILSTMSI